MDFCPKCESRLRLKQVKEHGKISVKLYCSKCNVYYTKESLGSLELKPFEEGASLLRIIDVEGDRIKTMPTTSVSCPKCGHDLAYWWLLQTRSGDEPPTQFYRCVSCNYTWRVYA